MIYGGLVDLGFWVLFRVVARLSRRVGVGFHGSGVRVRGGDGIIGLVGAG